MLSFRNRIIFTIKHHKSLGTRENMPVKMKSMLIISMRMKMIITNSHYYAMTTLR